MSDACIIFLPFVAKVLGSWGQISKDIISYISKRWADKHMENGDKSINWFYQKLSVNMHRGNANMIISRIAIVEFYSSFIILFLLVLFIILFIF